MSEARAPKPPGKDGKETQHQPVERDSSIIERFLDNQSKQLDNETKSIDLRARSLDKMHEYSLKALAIQDTTLKRKDGFGYKKLILKYIIGLIVFVIIISMIIYCIHVGKEQIAFEILKTIGIALISGSGAYFYGKSVGSQSENKNIEGFTDYEEIE